jgi:ribonuclease HI
MKYSIHTDGGARGNPGPAAVGVVIEQRTNNKEQKENFKTIAGFGKTIGETTNNVAEYTAVIKALEWLVEHKGNEKVEIQFYLDSTLVVNQLNGIFKVKDARLRELLMKAHVLEQEVGGYISYTAIPREQNTRADVFVNQALDELMSHVYVAK